MSAASTQSPTKTMPMAWLYPMAAAFVPVAFGVGWKDWLWWAALTAPCSGALAAGTQRFAWGLLASLSWVVAWLWLGRELSLDSQLGGVGGLVGLLSCGWSLTLLGLGKPPLFAAMLALALSVFLIGAPAGFWLFTDPPWSPNLAARLLDFSPAALLMESAGIDFLRLPAIYGPVGADSMDPTLRLAWGNLAGWGVSVVGLCVSSVACACRRRKTVPERKL